MFFLGNLFYIYMFTLDNKQCKIILILYFIILYFVIIQANDYDFLYNIWLNEIL